MCWCNPSIRTPLCGKGWCVPGHPITKALASLNAVLKVFEYHGLVSKTGCQLCARWFGDNPPIHDEHCPAKMAEDAIRELTQFR